MHRVREKKISGDKKKTFHRISPSITRTLNFVLCISLPYYMIYKGNEKQKKEETDTKLHKWEKLPLKTLLKLFSPLF